MSVCIILIQDNKLFLHTKILFLADFFYDSYML